MNIIGLIAIISALIFGCGLSSFGLMFSDPTPSQNNYSWFWTLPLGAVGLALSFILWFIKWISG